MAEPPTPLEVATGWLLGPGVPAQPVPGRDPLAELERAVLAPLRRPPCVLSFSGGADSSFVLAVAARVARRHGLPAPVPVTWRFTGAPRAQESAWQDRTMAALDLPDWTILRAEDDLDLVGPVADRVLRRHGQLHPVNVHLHLPIAELAAGGSLLTGAGGDQVLAGWRRTRRRPALRRALDPFPWLRRAPDPFPWLRPALSRATVRRQRAERRSRPRSPGDRLRWRMDRRDLQVTCASLAAVAADAGATVTNPLLDGGFLAAVGARLDAVGPISRAALLAGIAGGTLPPVVTAPRTKARFLEVFFRTPTRDFVRGWDGTGIDGDLVDVAVLRRLWSEWPIPPLTAGLVQQAWLTTAEASIHDRG
jgi:Asparagine synthase